MAHLRIADARDRRPLPCASRRYWAACGTLLAVVLLWPASPAAWAQGNGQPSVRVQQRRTVPSDLYFLSFANFYEGRYSNALRDFNHVVRSAIRSPTSRWIDSICYFTMRGETYYQMGRLPEALADYRSALELYVAFPDWMMRVDFPESIMPDVSLRQADAPWGSSKRGAKRGLFPHTVRIGQGQFNAGQVLARGGVLTQPQWFPVDAQEIVRCTALAIRRHTELLGPASLEDRLSKDVLAALDRRPGILNHWSEAWLDLQLGLAEVATGKIPQAKGHLERALLVSGEFDHPLSGVALLELGKIALSQGDLQTAARYFEEATYSVMRYPIYRGLEDATLLEEAFRLGLLVHLVSNTQRVYPPLEVAARWAKSRGYRQLQASLLIGAAENYLWLGDSRRAEMLLTDAQAAIGRRDMRAGRIGAELNFLLARLLYQKGHMERGDAALASALDYQRRGSVRLFHVSVADQRYEAGVFSPRVAMKVYQSTLVGPSSGQWAFEPLEALSLLLGPLEGPMENWFEVALKRRERDAAIEIADLARRHRFLRTLPLGGRLLALRWVLEAPEDALSKAARLQRRDLLSRYPQYLEASKQANQLRQALRQQPLVADDPEVRRRRAADLEKLAEVSGVREMMLRHIAVAREPSDLAFPRVLPAKTQRTMLPEGTAVLSFFATSKMLYAMLQTAKASDVWAVGSLQKIESKVVKLLQEMGQRDGNRELSAAQLVGDGWKKVGAELFAMLTEGGKSRAPDSFDELVIVPDGALWYVPFEALPLSTAADAQPLIARSRIRYVPLTSLAVVGLGPRAAGGRTVFVAGQLFGRDEPLVAEQALEELRNVMPDIISLAHPLPMAPAVLASMVDRLIVWQDGKPLEGDPFAWQPLPDSGAGSGATLAAWMQLPWGAPSVIVLPGFHSAAENSLRGRHELEPGDDLFLPICGLMASGTQNILISRWRVGGRIAVDLMREFLQELPHTSAADAWQRSVFIAMESPVETDLEPRVGRDTKGILKNARHPFFWAGYLLVDAGPLSSSDKEGQQRVGADAAAAREP